MTKALIIFILSLLSLTSIAQEEDSTFYEDDFIKDTTSTIHIGFTFGGLSQAVIYNASNNVDSLSISNSKPSLGFTFGIIVERDFSDKLWLRTGVNINISTMNISYKYNSISSNYYFNLSTLEVPIWFQYAFKTKQRGLSWGAGIKPNLDISRTIDYNNRLFEIKKATVLVGTGPNTRWQLNSGRWINLSLTFNIGLFNVFKTADNIYNNSIKSGRPWQFQMLISLD